MTTRLSAERLAEIRAFFVGGEGWVMKAVADLFAELDAVTIERDTYNTALGVVTRERDEARTVTYEMVERAYAAYAAYAPTFHDPQGYGAMRAALVAALGGAQ